MQLQQNFMDHLSPNPILEDGHLDSPETREIVIAESV